MKSIFDGWTKKVEGTTQDHKGGYCARGWIHSASGKDPCYLAEVLPCEERIGRWIMANMNPPEVYEYRHLTSSYPEKLLPLQHAQHAIVWANNECKLDIEGFKMADLLSQGYVPEEAPEVQEEETVSV